MPMGHAFRAVIFDLDGTLLDTLADIAHAMNTTLVRHGLPPRPLDAYRLMVGSGLEALVKRAAEPAADPDLLGTLIDELRDTYAADPVSRTKPYAGIHDLIETLKEMDVPLAVLSNKADELVIPIVAEFFRPDDFAVVRGMRHGLPAKPDPTSAVGIAAELSAAPAECVYLGDSDVDMHTARNAGMAGIGAAWGFRSPEELRASGARRIITTPAELVAIVVDGILESEQIREGR
jgi:phosphoglycolate phosphatase